MKIGILTFHRALNYGAFLQCFALKKTVESFGHDVEIIDYWPDAHAQVYAGFNKTIFKHCNIIGKLNMLIDWIFSYKKRLSRRKSFEKLWAEQLGLTNIQTLLTHNELRNVKKDIVLYGSDQIWWKSTIIGYEGFDDAYWGQHIPDMVRKVSYGASMGIINLNEDDKKDIRKWLSSFSAVSVRESDLKLTLDSFCNIPITTVLDPTLLLSKEEWSKYCITPKIDVPYILLFNLMSSSAAIDMATSLSRKYGYKVVELTASVNYKKHGNNAVQTASPFEFIGWIKKAAFVVTSSFHGTAFSIIFERPFVSMGMKNNSGRVASLLKSLCIEDRLVSGINMSEDEIDYTNVKDLLSHEREKSLTFLNHSIRKN